jgi:hypothetical protein
VLANLVYVRFDTHDVVISLKCSLDYSESNIIHTTFKFSIT